MHQHDEILNEWLYRIGRSHLAHNLAAAKYEPLNRRFGATAAVLSAVVGTAVFATLEASPSSYLKIFTGLISIAAAVLASLHTYLGYSDLAGRHKIAAARFGELRTQLEQIKAFPPASDEMAQRIALFCSDWDTKSKESPIISPKIFEDADRKTKRGAGHLTRK